MINAGGTGFYIRDDRPSRSAAGIDDVDFTGAATLRAIHETLSKSGVRLVFAHLSSEVQATLDKYEITGLLGKDALFDSLRTVVHAYERTRGDTRKE